MFFFPCPTCRSVVFVPGLDDETEGALQKEEHRGKYGVKLAAVIFFILGFFSGKLTDKRVQLPVSCWLREKWRTTVQAGLF